MESEQRPTLPPGWLPPTAVGVTPVAPGGAAVPPEPVRPSGSQPPSGCGACSARCSWRARFALKFGKVALLALPKLKILTDVRVDAREHRGVLADLGLEVRRRLRGPALHPRDGARPPAAAGGLQASAPMFIPFLGAVISAKSLGRDAAAEARVGLAGPDPGTAGAARASRSPSHGQRACSARWRSSGSS
jgi:hypothetical protein